MFVIRLNYNESSHILFTFLAEGKCDPPKQNTFLCRTAFSIWNAILLTSSKLDFNFALYIWNIKLFTYCKFSSLNFSEKMDFRTIRNEKTTNTLSTTVLYNLRIFGSMYININFKWYAPSHKFGHSRIWIISHRWIDSI